MGRYLIVPLPFGHVHSVHVAQLYLSVYTSTSIAGQHFLRIQQAATTCHRSPRRSRHLCSDETSSFHPFSSIDWGGTRTTISRRGVGVTSEPLPRFPSRNRTCIPPHRRSDHLSYRKTFIRARPKNPYKWMLQDGP